ncbi:MAG TPA: hypothetical protein VG407_17825 [Caulobacteraceae bacterium]|jgi:hypothetical protein|nr:hypothetical protein [Caulobacteraceae bacterium]
MATAAQDNRGPTSKSPRGGVARWLQILCLLFGAFIVAQDAGFCAWDFGLVPQAGRLGAGFDLNARGSGGGFVTVTSVEPNGALSRFVSVGDRVAFDRPYDYERTLRAGESVGFTVDHVGATTHYRIAVPSQPPVHLSGPVDSLGYFDAAFLICGLFGMFIVARSGRQTTPLLLGAALMTESLDWSTPPFWLSSPALYPLALMFGTLTIAWAIPVAFYAFALRFHENNAGPITVWEKALFWVFALVQALFAGLHGLARIEAANWPFVGDGNVAAFYVGANLGLAACVFYLFLGWRRSGVGVQQRYALMLIAASLTATAQVFGNLVSYGSPNPPLVMADAVLAGVVGPILFSYAILHHKVFDLGFALNRTLVYGVVSAILLAAFGLIEWAVDHFVPIEGREKNALIDAAIAVGVFLTFHRVRDKVEHVIENLFFQRWQKAEAALRQFVKEAPFFSEAPALTAAFVQAVSDYAEGAPAAVYLAEGSGYARACGEVAGVPARLETDLRPLVSLRADPKAIELHDDTLDAALIAPMVNRNEVIGLLLLGQKPSGHSLRPDEVELIAWATRQVGLDLHALKVERLEAVNADLSRTVAVLERSVALKPA